MKNLTKYFLALLTLFTFASKMSCEKVLKLYSPTGYRDDVTTFVPMVQPLYGIVKPDAAGKSALISHVCPRQLKAKRLLKSIAKHNFFIFHALPLYNYLRDESARMG